MSVLNAADLARVTDQHEESSEHLAPMEHWIQQLHLERPDARRETMKRIVVFLESYCLEHARWEERTVFPQLPRGVAAVLCSEHHVLEGGVRALAAMTVAPEPDAHGFALRAQKLLGALDAHFVVEERILADARKTAEPKPATATVGDLMTKDVFAARQHTLAHELSALMTKKNIHCVPVVNERGVPEGIVHREELLRLEKRRATSRFATDTFDPTYPPELLDKTTAADVMFAVTVVLDVDEPIHHAAMRMAERRALTAPVVGKDGAVTGVLSAVDILRHLGGSA